VLALVAATTCQHRQTPDVDGLLMASGWWKVRAR
jgi:hypothetical protein